MWRRRPGEGTARCCHIQPVYEAIDTGSLGYTFGVPSEVSTVPHPVERNNEAPTYFMVKVLEVIPQLSTSFVLTGVSIGSSTEIPSMSLSCFPLRDVKRKINGSEHTP